jgi:hypothetical protein
MNSMLARSSAVVAVATLIALVGCAAEEPAAVKEETDAPVVVVTETATETVPAVDAEASASSTPEPTEVETTAPSPPAAPELGDLVTVGEWDVKVTDVVLDAAAQMKAANMFNRPAKGQYMLVTYEATYTGNKRTADVWLDLSWSFTTSDSRIHDASSKVTPADTQEWPTEARTGGTVRGQQVWDVEKDLVKGGILTVEGYTKNYNEVYADFPM